MNQPMPTILLLAGIALLVSAMIPTLQWISCTHHGGGIACSPLAGDARDTWAGVSTVLLGIAYQPRGGQR